MGFEPISTKYIDIANQRNNHSAIFIKKLIQPLVPQRLPCYDFDSVINLINKISKYIKLKK